jgi:hypothetical protein
MVLVINDGEIIERGTHEELMEKKGFYFRVYMSQFKGTNGDDLEPIRLTPAEQTSPQFTRGGMPSISGMGGMRGMRGGEGTSEMAERMNRIAEAFRKKGATLPESALKVEELGLPQSFEMMMKGPMAKMGPFIEHKGRYYLSEERLEQMRKRHGG